MEIYNTCEGKFFEHLSPLTKLIWVILISIVAFFCAASLSLILVYIYVLMMFPLSSGIKRSLKPLLKMSAIVMLVLSLSQAFFYEYGIRNIRLFDGIVFSIDGFTYGLLESLIILTIASASILVANSTSPEDMIDTLSCIGVPHPISFMSTLTLRFLPVIMEDTKVMIRALNARGVRTDGIVGKFRSLKTSIIMLLIVELRRAEELSMAMTLRGYDPNTRNKYSYKTKFKKEDLMLFSSFLMMLLSILLMKMTVNIPLFLPPWLSV